MMIGRTPKAYAKKVLHTFRQILRALLKADNVTPQNDDI